VIGWKGRVVVCVVGDLKEGQGGMLRLARSYLSGLFEA
jgi:hypothetical protein